MDIAQIAVQNVYPKHLKQAKPKKEIMTIKQVFRVVLIWRKLIGGVLYNGKLVQYSPIAAAAKTGVPKKSLDDYLL